MGQLAPRRNRSGSGLIKSLRGGFLCILCLPSVKRPLLRMAADSAAKEIASVIR